MNHAMMGETESFQRERAATGEDFEHRLPGAEDDGALPSVRRPAPPSASDVYAQTTGWLA